MTAHRKSVANCYYQFATLILCCPNVCVICTVSWGICLHQSS